MIEKVLIIYLVFAVIFIYTSLKSEMEIVICKDEVSKTTQYFKSSEFFEEQMPVSFQCDYATVSTKYFYDELIRKNKR